MSKVLAKIRENSKRFPNRIAYSVEEKNKDDYCKKSITWKELEEKSNRVAGFFKEKFSTKNPVIVFGHKDPNMLITFIGGVKSGRGYVPIDSSFPEGRIKDIIEAVKPEVIIATEKLTVNNPYGLVISSEEIEDIANKYDSIMDDTEWVSGNDIFYIIFTSGSTGTPKGVQITSDCLDNFIKWAVTLGDGYIQNEEHHIFINQAPFSFDLSVFDLYLSLFSGGTEYAITKSMQQDMNMLYEYLSKSGADIWVSTPSFAEIVLADEKFNSKLLPNMRLFLFCGETLTNQTVSKLYEAFPDADVVNTYGPTESTVAMTSVLVDKDICKKYNPLPIGRPKQGTYVLIMDENGNIMPDGEKGEIVIIGDTVSTGYWENPKRNAEVFGTKVINGETYRMYHTRDKGYYLDGMLFYCGRIDLQIKLHGYRIEIEDIESNLLLATNVERAVVMPEYDNGKVISLTTYIVPKKKVESTLKERRRLREELKKKIPEYMIPKKFVFKDFLPVTSNGKVDRKKLEDINK